jgi:hypothetical protein
MLWGLLKQIVKDNDNWILLEREFGVKNKQM